MDNIGKSEHIFKGYDVLYKEARKQGKKSTSCTVYVPPEWQGKRVAVIRLE